MKKRDVFVMLEAISKLGEIKGSVKFSYALNKNKRVLLEEAKIIQESLEKLEDKKDMDLLKELEKDIDKLMKKYSTKDENGKPKRQGFGYLINTNDAEKAQEEVKNIEKSKKYLDVVKRKTELNNKNEELLNEKLGKDVKLHKIKLSDLPELTVQQQDSIFELINNSEDKEA